MSAKFGPSIAPIPAALPPSGAAGGQLSGTYPNPSVTSSHSGSTHAAATASAVSTSAAAVAAAGGSALIGDTPGARTVLTGATVFANLGLADSAIAARVTTAALAAAGGAALVGFNDTGLSIFTGATVQAAIGTADVALISIITGLSASVGGKQGALVSGSLATSVGTADTEGGWIGALLTPTGRALQTPATFVFEAWGVYTSGATPGTPVFRVRVGVDANPLLNAAAVALSPVTTASQTDAPWYARGLLTVRTDGVTGTVIANLLVSVAGVAGLVGTYISVQQTTITVDTTDAAIKAYLTFISGNAGTTYTVTQARVMQVAG